MRPLANHPLGQQLASKAALAEARRKALLPKKAGRKAYFTLPNKNATAKFSVQPHIFSAKRLGQACRRRCRGPAGADGTFFLHGPIVKSKSDANFGNCLNATSSCSVGLLNGFTNGSIPANG